MATNKKGVKGRSKGKLVKPKSKGKLKSKPKAKGKLNPKSPKKQYFVYREKETGRLVSAKNLDGTKKVKWEIWRYSKGTKRVRRIFKEDRYSFRKTPLTKLQLQVIAKEYYGKNKIKVKMINGEVYALTRSP